MNTSSRFHRPKIILNRNDWKKFKKIAKSGWVCNGDAVNALEKHFRDTFKTRYAIACSSATQGLIIALRASGIKNKKIAVPSFTWGSTLYAIQCSENYPIIVDVNKETFLADFHDIKADFYMPVDCFGNAYPKIKNAIYDSAHSYGLESLGKRGLAEVVSLSFTKPITGMQGGIILTNDDRLASEAKELRDLSSKMCEFNAIIALNSIQNLTNAERIKKQAIEKYRELLKITYTEQKILKETNYSVYAIVFSDKLIRDRVANELTRNGYEVKIYYNPLKIGLPNTDWLYDRILALPIYEEIISRIPEICGLINKAI